MSYVWRLAAVLLLASALEARAQDAKRTEFAATGWGSLKGKVTFEGELPKLPDLVPQMKKHDDARCCLAGGPKELANQTWLIDPKTKALANVVIWLKPPPKQYFPIHADDKVRKDIVSIDQPHCAFVPHVVGHFSHYFDGKKLVKSGQQFVVKNSATVRHNVRFSGFNNAGLNTVIKEGGEMKLELNPEKLPLIFQCDFHKWMSARVAVFDHPYFAVSAEDGTFQIPRVPAEAEVTVMAWHEAALYVFGPAGRTLTLREGDNELNFTATVRKADTK
jgi:hypothetical protein